MIIINNINCYNFSLQIYETESELFGNSSNHQNGDIGYTKDDNGFYIFVDGTWIKSCDCETINRKRSIEDDSVTLNKNEIQTEGTISRLWTRIMSWLGESSDNSNNDNNR